MEPEHHAGLGRNIGAFTLQDLLPHADADGRVTITVGPEENGSGPLHLRTAPARIQIFTRDRQSDWAQVQPAVTVSRLASPVDWRWPPAEAVAAAHIRDTPHRVWFGGGCAEDPWGFP